MRAMRSSRRPEVSAQQLTDHTIGTELTTAWKSLTQSKAALRHIENRLEAAPGSGVVLESVMDPKKKSSRTVRCRDGQHADVTAGSSKRRGRSQQSPEKSSSRSPLRNATQDSNVRRNNSVEFREPLASYREATPPPNPPSQLEAFSFQSSSSNPPSDPLLSQMVYHRDTRDSQTDRDQDSTRSSALEGTEVRFLNDRSALDSMRTARVSAWEQDNTPKPALDSMRTAGVRVSAWEQDNTPKAQPGMEGQESSPSLAPGSAQREENTPSSSPGSASQRLENLRRHQPDDKLEKLKERIRRQRQHLEEAAEREKLLFNLEQPDVEAVGSNNAGTSNMHKIIRKVAAAPPAPIYKGFNSTETKIQTPDGKVWKEEEFHNLSREIYRDLSRQFAESTRSRQQHQKEQRADRSRERRPPKPVRKVHRAAPSSEATAKPVISPASWRDGQKLVKMVLGPVPKLPREEELPADRLSRAASRHRSSSEPRSESNPRHRPSSSERPSAGFKSKSRCTATSTPQEKAQNTGVGTDLLSADIQGILDDLQLECRAAEREERARQRARGGGSARRGRGGSGSRTRTPVSAWGATAATGSSSRGCRSASPIPTSHQTQDPKKRHYDADSVRQYISRQQEERKRRQAEEKRAMKEEAERRNQRLKELYRKQREAVITAEAPEAPVQRRLQETYDKLLLEDSRLGEETQTQPAAESIHMRPMYQPSGESDKENKRLEAPQSPSSSDRSLNDQHPAPLSRNDLDTGLASLLQPEHLSSSTMAPYGDHFLSHLLRMESAVKQRPTPSPSIRPNSKMSRIEALKATAASLSNRIESEARKIAGDGVNYDLETPMDVIRPSQGDPDAGSWAENDDVASRIQRILTSTGHTSSYNGTALPGAGHLHALRGQRDSKGTHTFTNNPHTPADETGLNTHERERLVNGLDRVERMDNGESRREDKNGTLDSSAGSISEGPLLSEGSFSEDDVSPPHPSSSSHGRFPRAAAERLEAAEYCAGQRKDYHRLSEFQREAAKCSTLSYTQHDSSKAPWEELNKGSPLSVINIYTKNLQGRLPGSERNPPSALPPPSANGHVDAAVYEDDFVSLHSSGASAQLKRGSNSRSVNSHFEELMRRSPYDKSTGGISSQHSSFHSSIHSSIHSPHLSSGSTPASSKHSARRIGAASDHSDGTLVEDHRSSCSPPSDALSSDSRRRASDKSSPNSQARSVRSNEASGETPELSHHSKKSSALRHRKASPSSSGSPPGGNSPGERSGSLGGNNPNTSARSGRAETKTTGDLQYSPAVLQQRMAAELHHLETMEESVRQLGDVERVMGVSMAQQESVSLAQMLKARQLAHDRDLYELKIKAEREALETQLQLEENRQRVARAHQLQENLASNQKDTLEGLQEAAKEMMSHQAEAARYTADTARHIREMAELARSQISGVLAPRDVSDSSMLDEREEQQSSYSKQRHDRNESDSFSSEVSNRRTRPEETLSSLNSLSPSDSLSFRRPNISGADSSSHHSPSHAAFETRDRTKKDAREGKRRKETRKEEGSSSIEEEVQKAANDSLCSDSIPSAVDNKGDTTSVATEYSLKFDESMTEDEIEERSFRSLLPSEAHRRGTMEKKPRPHDESEDDGANHNATVVSGVQHMLKPQDTSMSFAGGQDSFSQFTMDMVRQYMKDEEVRLQHQSSLLHLRQKAVKEKTKAELAWLEHQKKRLRDKGEDDKMPPIRKKQRGLLMKLQQEQAEIKRLQEANKAARKERQLLLKQQEEIERMRNSTLRLKERLKSAGGETPPETPVSETPLSESASPNMRRSPSPPLSISGSETSSIMQKLKKMRSHTDEKLCSPVHCFFSVFTAHHWASLSVCLPNLHPKFQIFIYNHLVRFLTKREQVLMQRRHHAEELLQWKQRLDREEAEVRRMEKEALALWDRTTSRDGAESRENEVYDISPSLRQSSEPRTDSEKEYVSEDCSSVTPDSSVHTEGPQTGSPASDPPASNPETPSGTSVQNSPANYSQDFTSPSRQSLRGSLAPAASPSHGSKMQLRASNRTDLPPEHISDQSDIESRIRGLKEEVRKRKFMAYQLKKEQKKRHKEHLKAQEASLLKQLESYNNFIEKTKAELNKKPDSTPDNSQIRDSVAEQTSITTPADRCETGTISGRTHIEASLDHNAVPQPDLSRPSSVPEELSDEDPPTVTPTPVHGSPQRSYHEPEVKVSSTFEDQPSERLLVSKASVTLEEDKELKTREASEAEKSNIITSNNNSAAEELNLNDRSASSDSFSIKDVEGSSPRADAYHDDFESSVDSSPRDHDSKPASQISRKDEEEVEEEVSEDLSHRSGTSGASRHSARLLDFQNNAEESKLLHSPPSPVRDEMLSFNIGDRVLVGGVQPGTLRFKGPTSFANGYWAGVELDKSEGSNNGTYDDVVYFECDKSHGIFAPPDKISHLPDKFEIYADTTEDEDSFCDPLSEKGDKETKKGGRDSEKRNENEPTSNDFNNSGDKRVTDISNNNVKESKHPISNGTDIMLHFEDAPTTLLISDIDLGKQNQKEIAPRVEREEISPQRRVDSREVKVSEEGKQKALLDSVADQLLNNFMTDTVAQFAEIKRAKEQKIDASNQMNGEEGVDEEEEEWFPSVQQKDGLPFFLPSEKEEMTSPELCNQPESPILGVSGQEELVKRLAELELSRGLLEDLGDDQDWFDEDFGLSSRREQQRIKRREEDEEEDEEEERLGRFSSSLGGFISSSGGEQQVKIPPRPELPLPLPPKLPEQPAMVVPHSATEVEKMVHVATQEIWESSGLGREGGARSLAQMPTPQPSQEYLGRKEAGSQEQEAVCIHSYRKAVFDLTWEMLQEIYNEEPSSDQPQWVKPRRVRSSFFHRVKSSGDLNKIQEFISAEVLKVYGLSKDHSLKTDWQKMLKFGKKKRDRVDHILVQELHEEEAQWVNYDEDELFVKMQLADSIFDALLKDTANTLTLIYDKRAKRENNPKLQAPSSS
ncbi:centrosome-associated protein 350 isoform X5 [Gymnodraco acuticeps]|uniref:Centrosome-associated protein 350 isoform X5 n=2 Tax=Notothenioidei TaxID=8205 RepID=A0A6P8U9W2_GYMAC|nr:centrosome-associated protein 350 isoform X5 [Gymnodraco acuticeps]